MASNTPTLMQSEEARAPWNEPMPQPSIYDVMVCETITRNVQVEAFSEEEAEEECRNGRLWSLDDLLNELKSYVEQDLERYKGSSKMEKVCKDILYSIENYDIETTEISCL